MTMLLKCCNSNRIDVKIIIIIIINNIYKNNKTNYMLNRIFFKWIYLLIQINNTIDKNI